jgi:hypothetical protein
MRSPQRSLAVSGLLLLFPSVLFMGALVVRSLQPVQYEPARAAQRIVDWYALRPHVGLWVMLIALPFLVLVSGCVALWRAWSSDPPLRQAARRLMTASRAHWTTLFIACATLTAGAILAIVALHVARN